jgi:hypothetical protein
MVYVPTGQRSTTESPDGTEISSTIELRRTGDGRTALLVYSALDRLIACCGEHQSWVVVKSEHLQKIYAAQPYDVIMLDAPLPEDIRHAQFSGSLNF